jgi:hypothetical protein
MPLFDWSLENRREDLSVLEKARKRDRKQSECIGRARNSLGKLSGARSLSINLAVVQVASNNHREGMKVTRICHWFPGEGGNRT